MINSNYTIEDGEMITEWIHYRVDSPWEGPGSVLHLLRIPISPQSDEVGGMM